MKIARPGTFYIVVAWMLIVAILGSVLFIGYRRNIADLRQLMMNEAERLIETVDVSAAAGVHALDEVEGLTAQRLLDNAYLIELLTRSHGSYSDSLPAIARHNDLHMINILDKHGESEARSNPPEREDRGEGKKHRPEVESVVSGKSAEEVIGFMDESLYTGKRYGVVVQRRNGGAVMVNTDSDDMLAFRKEVGLGTLFNQIGSLEGISYIVLQDTLGIVAASRGVTEMTRIYDDPFLLRAYKGAPGSRMTRGAAGGILEVVRPLIVDDVNLGLVRIGLSTAVIDGIKDRAIRQFIILFLASVISGVFVLSFVILRQNYLILNAEHDRILREVRIMEEQTRRSERLASMGRLAAGVAHEIRNPLNSISIITQRLRAEFTAAEDREEYGKLLSTVGKEITRISTIVENFMKYARPPSLAVSDVDCAKLISEVIGVIGEKAKKDGIRVEASVKPGLRCYCDYDQMKQALLNIVLNALDAVGKDGAVYIAAERANGEVLFRIEDTGGGIPEDIQANIFDPYFTTKRTGTGLGLSEVHRIVTAHNGRITVENGKRGGAVFSIVIGKEKV